MTTQYYITSAIISLVLGIAYWKTVYWLYNLGYRNEENQLVYKNTRFVAIIQSLCVFILALVILSNWP